MEEKQWQLWDIDVVRENLAMEKHWPLWAVEAELESLAKEKHMLRLVQEHDPWGYTGDQCAQCLQPGHMKDCVLSLCILCNTYICPHCMDNDFCRDGRYGHLTFLETIGVFQ